MELVFIAAKKFGASEIIDPRPSLLVLLIDTYKKYSHLDKVLPAMGYGPQQIKELENTVNCSECRHIVVIVLL